MQKYKPDESRPSQVGQSPRLLNLRQVIKMTGMSRSLIYAEKTAGRFPTPVRVGARGVRWIESEVVEYIRSRPRVRSKRPRR